MSYKTTDGLMRHLRDNGIRISGSLQKRQLMNTGYFHGYKGYRFFNSPNNRLPFSSYDEVCVIATILAQDEYCHTIIPIRCTLTPIITR